MSSPEHRYSNRADDHAHPPVTPDVMTDHELLERFEKGTLAGECFHHRDHVRAAFLYLSRYPAIDALRRFSGALRRFAGAQGKPHLYHETITWAYMLLIRERMARAGREQRWEEFVQANPDLLIWKPSVLQHYYREETLWSELARTVFVFPDRGLTPAADGKPQV